MSFDDFMKIPGCTTGSHSSEKSEVKAPVVTAKVQEGMASVSLSETASDPSTSTAVPVIAKQTDAPVATNNALPTWKERPVTPAVNVGGADTTNGDVSETPVENDPDGAVIAEGSKCKRPGCRIAFTSTMSRTDDECQYHSLPAIFHEGSKGYACCKRRVLEFDEFLKIEGCKRAKHCFLGQQKPGQGEEELVQCRHDMYQTPKQVSIVSICI